MPEHDVEIYYALHGGKPLFIGGGSHKDVDRLDKEGEAIDADLNTSLSTDASPGTRHFFQSLGEIAGVRPLTEAALDHYDSTTEANKQAWRQKIIDAGE